MYHQDLEQEHFPPPFILTSEATLTDLIFYATFFFDVKGLLSAESNIAIDAAWLVHWTSIFPIPDHSLYIHIYIQYKNILSKYLWKLQKFC